MSTGSKWNSGQETTAMAKQIRVLLPLTDAEIATILQIAVEAEQPLAAKQIASKAVVSRKVTEAEVTPLLDQHVQAGKLFLVPTATASGKPQYWGRDLNAVIADALRNAVAKHEAPATAAELAKGLSLPFKIKPLQIEEQLTALVAGGQLRSFPPATTKGKPRYWDRDPAALLQPAILAALQAAPAPISVKDLPKKLKTPVPASLSDITTILESCVAQGSAYRFPPSTAKGQIGYWNQSPSTWAHKLIPLTIEKKGPQQEAALRKLASFLSDAEFQQALNDLIHGNHLYRHPPVGKVKKTLLALQPPRPEPYLQPVAEQLQAAISALKAASVSDDQLRRALVQLLESTGISFGQTTPLAATTTSASNTDLERLIRQIEPGAGRGALVGIRDLRRASPLSKSEFDTLLLSLSRQGRLSLHRHDYPASLTPEERNDLVIDTQGTYYVGVALRQN